MAKKEDLKATPPTTDELAKLAYEGTIPSAVYLNVKPHEWLLWYRLRDLYDAVKNGTEKKEKAAKIKARALELYNADKAMYARHTLLWNRIATAGNRYIAVKTIENADAFYKAVYGVEAVPVERGEAEQ